MSGDLYYRVSVRTSGASYDLSDDLSSLTVDQREGQPDSLSVEIADPYKVLSHAVQEGMDIEVELGTDDDHAVVFRGRIYTVDGTFPTSQTPVLKITAYDASMRMGLRRRNKPWSGRILSDIVHTVAKEYFARIDVSLTVDPELPDSGIRQHEETDLCFLRRLAAFYGCILHVTAGDTADTFHFIARKPALKMDPAVAVFYGRTDVDNQLLSFQASVAAAQIELPRALSGIDGNTGKATELDTTKLEEGARVHDACFDENLAAFTADHPDKALQIAQLLAVAPVAGTALRSDLGSSVRAATPAFLTEAQQSALAQSHVPASPRGMRASGSTVGIRRMTAQTMIAIGDVGGRFSGNWFLTQVRHILDNQGYRTEFECQR